MGEATINLAPRSFVDMLFGRTSYPTSKTYIRRTLVIMQRLLPSCGQPAVGCGIAGCQKR
jgi:hypothetical protein